MHPCGQVTTIDITGTDYFGALRSGEIDVALGRFHQDPPADLVQGPVMSQEDWLLGVAVDHPLAGLDDVSVEELASYPIFGVPDALTGKLHNPLYPVVTPSGRPIERRGIARTFAEVLALVAGKEIVFPATESFPRYYGHPGVVFVPLRGWPPGTRTLIWRAHEKTPLIGAFIRLATQEPPRQNPGYGTWIGPRTLGE